MREEEEEEEENNLLVANSNCWKHAAAVIVVVVEEEEVVVIYFFLYSLPLQLVAQHGNKRASKRERKKEKITNAEKIGILLHTTMHGSRRLFQF